MLLHLVLSCRLQKSTSAPASFVLLLLIGGLSWDFSLAVSEVPFGRQDQLEASRLRYTGGCYIIACATLASMPEVAAGAVSPSVMQVERQILFRVASIAFPI